MMRRPPRLPRPAIPHRILRTPPEPGMTDPTSGFSTSSRWSDEYSSSVRYCPTKRVNSLVSTKLIIRELYVNDVVRQDGEVCACGLTIQGNRRAATVAREYAGAYPRVRCNAMLGHELFEECVLDFVGCDWLEPEL